MKKTLSLVLFIIALTMMLCIGFAVNGGGKDAPVLILEAEHARLEGPASLQDFKVGNIGFCGGNEEGRVIFEDLDLPKDGEYTLKLYYCSGSDDRNFIFYTHYDDVRLECPNTGSFTSVGTILIDLELRKGGDIVVGTDWYGPDLDKIEIYEKGAFDFVDKQYSNPDNAEIKYGELSLKIDKNNGVYSIVRNDKIVVLNAHSETKIDGDIISSDDFEKHEIYNDTEKKTVTVTHSGHSKFSGTLKQEFTFKDDYITARVIVSTNTRSTISTNYISVMSSYKDSLKLDNGVFVKIPFDNDMWVQPKFIREKDLGHTITGYEVAAYYNEKTLEALVCGSLTHDTWKSAVDIYHENGSIMGMSVFAGVSDSQTRDTSLHGYVSGNEVSSPLMFIGVYDDWRDGLVAYGEASAEVVPPKKSVSEVPFGFNSWGSLQSSVNYGDMVAISGFIKDNLQSIWQDETNNTVYINVDSFWDYLADNDPYCNMDLDEALKSFVEVCRKNGQKAGIYFTPFAVWYSGEEELKNTVMVGSDYTYYDAALRRSDGKGLYGMLDGGYALDPTHPGTIARIEDRFNYFISLGFEYLKLDFLTHGALEGEHYLEEITTGMQAYNYGMAKIHEICDGKMFVNLSIAPIFPYQYADGRRISCDAFASIDNTRHVLSYLTACFWQKSIYTYPDPDHIVVLGVDENVARCRVTSGVISGTSFLVGDDLSNIKEGGSDYDRIMSVLGNKDIISVAKLGKMFMPYNVDPDKSCAEIYYYDDGNELYIAVFNFDAARKITLDLNSIAGVGKDLVYGAKELWSGKDIDASSGIIEFSVGNNDAAVFKISKTPSVIETETATPDNTQTETKIPVVDPNKTNTPDYSEDDKSGLIFVVISVSVVCVIAAAFAILAVKRKKN